MPKYDNPAEWKAETLSNLRSRKQSGMDRFHQAMQKSAFMEPPAHQAPEFKLAEVSEAKPPILPDSIRLKVQSIMGNAAAIKYEVADVKPAGLPHSPAVPGEAAIQTPG
jgi:hypothetical protein